jgi:hypothetical protein
MPQGQVKPKGTQDMKPNECESLLGERKRPLDGQVVIRDRHRASSSGGGEEKERHSERPHHL